MKKRPPCPGVGIQAGVLGAGALEVVGKPVTASDDRATFSMTAGPNEGAAGPLTKSKCPCAFSTAV
jgi:hypothetical protein